MTKPPLPLEEGRGEGIQQCNLHGLGVLITRPQHQAQPLYDAILRSGGKPVLFPAIEIGPPDNPQQCKQQLQKAKEYDDLIFISPNAVRYSISDIAIDSQRIFSIGSATSRMLSQYHITSHPHGSKKTDSENLLASPLLGNMQGRRVLILRGNGGRELLANTLVQRGATVEYAEVYQRRCPDVDTTSLLRTWTQKIDVVIATSNTVIDNLLHLCQYNPLVLQTPLVVISRRILSHAEKSGFVKITVSSGSTKAELLQSLLQLSTNVDICP